MKSLLLMVFITGCATQPQRVKIEVDGFALQPCDKQLTQLPPNASFDDLLKARGDDRLRLTTCAGRHEILKTAIDIHNK